MNNSVGKKIALITGASRGIGAATARLLAKQGYDICINYLKNKQTAENLVAELKPHGTKIICIQADIGSEADIVRLFSEVDNRLGTLSALVNNAGILMQQTTIAGLNEERMQRIFATNIIGSILCAREAVERMSTSKGGKGGAIVNVSSAASRFGSPDEYLDYAASKGAIDTFTIGLGTEVAAQGIRVNAVRPGVIDTEMHGDGGEPNRVARIKPRVPMKRGGKPEEVAQAIAWLLSDNASYSTGAILDVSGGR